MLSKRCESTEVDRRTWLHVPSGTLWSIDDEILHAIKLLKSFKSLTNATVFQSYRDLEAGDNQSVKIQVARPGIEPRSSCSASQDLNHSATAAPKK